VKGKEGKKRMARTSKGGAKGRGQGKEKENEMEKKDEGVPQFLRGVAALDLFVK